MEQPAPSWMHRLAGRFVVFDGPDGSGKSTQFHRFHHAVEAAGVTVCEVREPGGTAVGEQVRALLLDPGFHEVMDLRCEMLLFMASRSQLIAQRIRPALEAKQLVLADRFVSSTLAYQGAAGGLPIDDIQRVADVAMGDTRPDLTVVFDVDERTAAERLNPLLRASEFGQPLDRMEVKGAAFHRKVRQGYLDQARSDPEHYAVIDAGKEPRAVFEQLIDTVQRRSADW